MDEISTKPCELNIMILFLSKLHYLHENSEDKVLEYTGSEETYTVFNGNKVQCIETNEAPLKDVLLALGSVQCIETNETPLKDVLLESAKSLDAIFYFSTNLVGIYPPLNEQPTQDRIKIKFSSGNNKSKTLYYDSQAHFFWKERAKAADENLIADEKLHPVQFDETTNDDPVKTAITSVRDMEKTIKAYLEDKEVPMSRCNIYVDITGGFRPANMAMSAVMQLLTYQGANLKRVVYSDINSHTVYNVHPINDMYRLVAGVDAFTKYGNSAALDEYFADVKETYKPLNDLLESMKKFSESIMLCQPYDIENNLKSLIESLENFSQGMKNDEERPVKVELFARMVDDIREKYTPMYPEVSEIENRETDRIEIIRWCVKNNLLQQAVTFCTEWLPNFLFEHGVIYTDDLDMQAYLLKCKGTTNKKGKNGDKFGMKHFVMKEITTEFLVNEVYENPIKEKIIAVIDKKMTESEVKKFFPNEFGDFWHEFVSFLDTIPEDNSKITNEMLIENKKLETLVEELTNPTNNATKMKRENIKGMHIRIKLKTSNLYRELFNLPDAAMVTAYNSQRPKFKKNDQSGNAARLISAMLNCGILKTNLESTNKAVYYIEEYTYIRANLRNKINHVDTAGSSLSNDSKVEMNVRSIAEYLRNYLDELSNLKDMPRPSFIGLWAENSEDKK